MAGDSPVKLMIAIASGRGWAVDFGQSLALLLAQLVSNRLGGRLQDIQLHVQKNAYLVCARNDSLTKAIDGGFTHYLSLDDDMAFNADVVDRLIAHDKPVITANYRKKTPERVEYVCGDLEGEMLDTTCRTGIERIGSMGMGMTLIDLATIKHVPRPYFAVLWDKAKEKFIIEDGVFSALLREKNVEVWTDHDVSRQVGHVGEFMFVPPEYVPMTIPIPSENEAMVSELAALSVAQMEANPGEMLDVHRSAA